MIFCFETDIIHLQGIWYLFALHKLYMMHRQFYVAYVDILEMITVAYLYTYVVPSSWFYQLVA